MSGPDVEGVLAGHRSLIQVGQAKACTCGWEDGFVPDATEAHRAHVAAAVLAEVRAWLESEGAVDVAKAAAKHGSLDRFASDYIAEDGREWLAGFAARAALAALAEQVGQVAPSCVPREGS